MLLVLHSQMNGRTPEGTLSLNLGSKEIWKAYLLGNKVDKHIQSHTQNKGCALNNALLCVTDENTVSKQWWEQLWNKNKSAAQPTFTMGLAGVVWGRQRREEQRETGSHRSIVSRYLYLERHMEGGTKGGKETRGDLLEDEARSVLNQWLILRFL